MEAIERFLDFQIPDEVRISPDGKHVVYQTQLMYGHKTGENAVGSIWIADVGEEKSARQLTSGLFKDYDPQWAPDGRSIFFLSDRAGVGKRTAIYELNLAGGEPIPITDTSLDKNIAKFLLSPHGKHLAYLSPDEDSPERAKAKVEKDDAVVWGEDWQFNRLRIIHLATKTVESIRCGDYHIDDIVYSPDSKTLAFAAQPTPEVEAADFHGSDLYILDLATRKITHLCQYEYASRHSSTQGGHRWLGDRIFVTCNALPGIKESFVESSSMVCSVSVIDGSWRQEVGGSTFCANDLCGSGDTAVFRMWDGLYEELRTSDETLYRGLCTIESFDAIRDQSGQSQLVVAFVKSTVNEPDEVYTLTSSTQTPIRVSNHVPEFVDAAAVAIEVHTRSSDDKVELDSLFLAPKDLCSGQRPDKPLKTFVSPHGGPYDRITSCFLTYFGWSQTLIRSGYAFYYPNYRGGASRGSSFASPYRTGEHDHDDVVALTQAAVARGLADPTNLIIGGWSQGGLITYLAAVRNGLHGYGWKWCGAVAGAGVSHPDTMIPTSDIPLGEAAFSGGAPWELETSLMPTKRASALRGFKQAADEGRVHPMLLLHGEEDERVPVTQAWGFHRACRARGLECKMVTYPRSGHFLTERKQLLDMHRRIVKFCDEHFVGAP